MDPKIIHRLPVQLDNKNNLYQHVNADKYFYSTNCLTFRGRPLVSREFILAGDSEGLANKSEVDVKSEIKIENYEISKNESEHDTGIAQKKSESSSPPPKFQAHLLKLNQDTKKIINSTKLDKIIEYEYSNWSKNDPIHYLNSTSLAQTAEKLEAISSILC